MRNRPTYPVISGLLAVGLGALVAHAAAPPTPQKVVTAKEYLNISGVAVADLTGNAKFPDNPDSVNYPGFFEWPASDDLFTPPAGDVRNTYGVQITGYFYPPSNGDYVFYLAADDGGQLFLSTDETPANKKLIAEETGWSGVRAFTSIGGGSTIEAKNSSTFAGTQWPVKDAVNGGATITLQANRIYYIEALMKEEGGGDNLAVAVQDPNFAIDFTLPIPGDYLSSFDKTSGPVSITTQPQSQTVDEGTPVTFSVVADGTPPYTYQWKKGGGDIVGETGAAYSIPFAAAADNGAMYSVAVTGAQGSVTSAEATLTVNVDNTPPTVLFASGGGDFVSVTVTYSERMDAVSAGTSGNYTISDGITVSAATVVNDTTVVLTTSRQTGGETYTLTINGVKDQASTPNTIAANTAVQFNSAVFASGLVQFERWNGAGAILDFVTAVGDGSIGPADIQWIRSDFTSGRGLGDNYRGRGYGWFKAPANGNYVFIMTVDDNARLFLSTDEDPANKKAIAAEATWSDERQWSATTEEQRSDTYAETEWPDFWTITLQQDQVYYIEALWQEGGGGDGCEVTYIMEGDATPANGAASVLTGSVIGIYVDPASLPPVVTTPPAGGSYKQGDTLTMNVTVTSPREPVTYQWFRNKVAIPGATSNPLVIPNAGVLEVGDYSVQASNPNGSVTANGGTGDDNARWIMENAFLIECEDWNYEGGKTMAAASTMPYLGGAYNGLVPTLDVDFNNDGDESGGAAFDYNRHTAADAGVLELKGGTDVAGDPENSGDAVANPLGRNRARHNNAPWEVTVNYATGWTDAGDWQNYTRTFPQGRYNVVLSAAHDGLAANEINMILYTVDNPTVPDNSTPNTLPPGGAQGITEVGRFLGGGTGAWSSNDFFPLRDTNGNLAAVDLDGQKTLRLMFNAADGDGDLLLLYPAAEGGGIGAARIAVSGTSVTITEDPPGGSTVQSATSALGPWTDLGAAPQTRPVSSAAAEYFRLKQP